MIAHEERVEICLARCKSILQEAEMDTTQNLKTCTINNRCYKILPFQYRRKKTFRVTKCARRVNFYRG